MVSPWHTAPPMLTVTVTSCPWADHRLSRATALRSRSSTISVSLRPDARHDDEELLAADAADGVVGTQSA